MTIRKDGFGGAEPSAIHLTPETAINYLRQGPPAVNSYGADDSLDYPNEEDTRPLLGLSMDGETAWLARYSDLLGNPAFGGVFTQDAIKEFAEALVDAVGYELTGMKQLPNNGITPDNIPGGLIDTLREMFQTHAPVPSGVQRDGTPMLTKCPNEPGTTRLRTLTAALLTLANA